MTPESLAAIFGRAGCSDAEHIRLPAEDFYALVAGLRQAWHERDVALSKANDMARAAAQDYDDTARRA